MWVLCERNAQQATTLFLLGGSGTVEVVGSSREWKILTCLCVFLGDLSHGLGVHPGMKGTLF